MSFFQKKKKDKSAKGMFSKKLFGGAFSNKLFEGGAFADFFLGNEGLHSSLFSGDKELEKVLDGELVIGEGSTGAYVIKIQKALNWIYKDDKTFTPLKEQKDFGPHTKAAVIRYQKDRKLKNVEGAVGQETMKKLDEEIFFREITQVGPNINPTTQQEETKIGPAPPQKKDYGKESNLSIDEYFYGQRVNNPLGFGRDIPENAIPIMDEKGQCIAYYVDNKMIQGLFVFVNKKLTWTREDGKTDFELHDDAVMRKQEPWSWGMHKAASDLGGAVIQFINDPVGYIGDIWHAIKGLKNLDVDKTWERIKNMDETDVSYVMTTLFLAKIGGAGKAGGSIITATGEVAGYGMKYFEEIYRFLQKSKVIGIFEAISNSQLYDALRGAASSKLGGALEAAKQFAKSAADQAHHIIPLELIKNERVGDFVRKAYDSLWDVNGEGNGIWVKQFTKATKEGVHAYHPNYTKRVIARIEKFMEKNGGKFDGPLAKQFLEQLSADLKKLIEEKCVKGGIKIDDLVF